MDVVYKLQGSTNEDSFFYSLDSQSIEYIKHTVKSRISGTQNSGKSRISGQFLNDQLFIRYRMNNQNSGKSRNSGSFLSDQRFH